MRAIWGTGVPPGGIQLLASEHNFSAFSMDVVLLYERGAWASAALYIIASVMLALGGLVLGLRLARLALV